jgi:2-isopropylmalate synthase
MVVRQRTSREVLLSDTTLRDGEQMPRVAFSAESKVRIACALERAGIHSLDAGFAAAGPQEMDAIRHVAATVGRPVVMSLARARRDDVEAAAQALEGRPRHKRGIGLFIGTSPLHREHKCDGSTARLLTLVEDSVGYAARYFDIIAFSAEDATRTEPEVLAQCFRVAIDAGATTVAFPDTVGVMLPSMVGDLVRQIQDSVPTIGQALLAVHFHDDLGLAVANSLAAIAAGVHVVQCTVGGIGERAGNAALEEVALALTLHAAYLGRQARVDSTALLALCRLVADLSGIPIAPNKAVAGANVFATEAGIHQDGLLKDVRLYQAYAPELIGADPGFQLVIGKHSGRHALASRLSSLGMTLDADELGMLLDQIKALARPCDADDDVRLLGMVSALRAQSTIAAGADASAAQ